MKNETAELKVHVRLPARAEVAALMRRVAASAQAVLAMELRVLFLSS